MSLDRSHMNVSSESIAHLCACFCPRTLYQGTTVCSQLQEPQYILYINGDAEMAYDIFWKIINFYYMNVMRQLVCTHPTIIFVRILPKSFEAAAATTAWLPISNAAGHSTFFVLLLKIFIKKNIFNDGIKRIHRQSVGNHFF